MQGIIFDMDGVIFDTEQVWQDAFFTANQRFGLSLTEEFRQSTCGKSEALVRKELAIQYPELDVPGYRNYMLQCVNDRVAAGDFAVKEGFLELIALIKREGYRVALATSSGRLRAEHAFKVKNLDIGMFDTTVFGEDVKERSKPDPYIFQLATQRLGLPAYECFVLEDSINGIESAVRSGFSAVMVVDKIPPNDYCLTHCKKIIGSLVQMPSVLREKNESN